MKIKLLIVFLFAGIFISGALFSAEVPNWVNEPDKLCKDGEFCAVGNGNGANLAKADARNQIAKIFETKITSNFSQSTTSSTSAGQNQNLSEEISEDVDEALSGIEIKKTYEGKNGYYAFAVIKKMKAANVFKSKIEQIDEQMKAENSLKTPASAAKLQNLYKKREALALRYEFLTNQKLPPPVALGEIFAKKKSATSGVILFVNLKEENVKKVEPLLIQQLTDNGYKVVIDDKHEKMTHKVTGEFTFEKMFINVPGWEKYRFLLHLYGAKADGVKSGAITFETIEQGRNFDHARDLALPKIKAFIAEKLPELNIE